MTSSGVLSDLRIVAVEQFGAGPFATAQFAALGADVIKIEDPASNGDIGRHVPPGVAGDDSLYFETFNRGKRSIALDLKSASGQRVLAALVARSDAVLNNLRGNVAVGLGLSYASLRDSNPAIVCTHLSGYGTADERASLPGYDVLVQAEAGWASITGEPDGPPVRSGLSLVDYSAGYQAALATLAAVHRARVVGNGQDVHINLYDTAIYLLTYAATWYLSVGHVTGRRKMSGHPSLTPFEFFRTSDGHLAVACAKEKFFSALCEVLDASDPRGSNLGDDDRYRSFEARRRNRAQLHDALQARFELASTNAWMSKLRGRVPVAPVRAMEEALSRSELSARGLLHEYRHPTLGDVTCVLEPYGNLNAKGRDRAPMLDEDRADLLSQFGISSSEAEQLARAGAFGDAG